MPDYRMTTIRIPMFRGNREQLMSQHMTEAGGLGYSFMACNVYWAWQLLWFRREYHFFWVKMV